MKSQLALVAMVSSVVVPNFARADEDQQNFVAALNYSLAIQAKCVGKDGQGKKYMSSIRRYIVANGTSDDDYTIGSLQGIMTAENNYPDDTKPPRKVCESAEQVKKGVADKIVYSGR